MAALNGAIVALRAGTTPTGLMPVLSAADGCFPLRFFLMRDEQSRAHSLAGTWKAESARRHLEFPSTFGCSSYDLI